MKTEEFILLIDADKEDVEMVRSIIKEEDEAIGVVVAYDGREALDAAMGVGRFATNGLKKKPLFVMVDLDLPKLNGHVVLQLLRQDEHGKDLPIIVMASSQDETAKLESSSIGATEVILKPLSKDKLRALLHKYRRPKPKKSSVHVYNALS